jgi:hypothetical protein
LALCLSVAYGADICKTTSVAQNAVDSVTDFAPYANQTTFAGLNSALEALRTAVVASSGAKFGRALVIAYTNGNFFGWFNCRENVGYCGGATDLYLVSNAVVLGDTDLYYFTSTIVNGSSYDAYGASNYLTAEWYTKATASLWGADLWTLNPIANDLVGTYDGGFSGAYVYRKTFTGGVIAGWRSGAESCGTCYVPTFGPSVAVANAASAIPTSNIIGTFSDFQLVVNYLLPFVVNNSASASAFVNSGYINFIIGYESDLSFMIKDCGFLNGGGSAQCASRGNSRYQLWVSAPNVFGNNTRQVYNLNDDGSIGNHVGIGNSPAAPSGAYDVVSRAFYVARHGWTNVAVVADATATLNRRFVLASGEGEYSNGEGDGHLNVVGGEFVDNGEGVCSSTAVTATISLMGLLAVLVAIVQL